MSGYDKMINDLLNDLLGVRDPFSAFLHRGIDPNIFAGRTGNFSTTVNEDYAKERQRQHEEAMKRFIDAIKASQQPANPQCWGILGIPQTNDRAVIISAFRKKAKATHPDTGGSAEEFHKLTKAKNEALRMIA